MYKILNHSEIDTDAWDACISNAANASLYGKSWYLDILAGNWKGIVKGNYEAVFPLISRKKYGMKYVCQPMGVPHVAWYTATTPDPLDFTFLFNHITTQYDLAEFNFMCQTNHSPRQTLRMPELKHRVKQCLNLRNGDFTALKKGFRSGHRYAIRRATSHAIKVSKNTEARIFWQVTNATQIFNGIPGYYQNRSCMERLIDTSISNHTGQIWTAYHGEKPLSSAFLAETSGILYLIFLFTHEEGRTQCVNHLLVQEIIRYNCQQMHTLDFGGSNIEKIALFNRGFGTKDHYYMAIKSGRMCHLISKLKALVR